MTQDKAILLNQVEGFIKEIYTDCLPQGMYFHNFEHTLLVVEGVQLISGQEGCTAEEKFVLILSAMLHDIGYSRLYLGHEEVGATMAAEFLRELNVDEDIISQVGRCIMATRYPQKPGSKIEYIICDADFYHFSLRDYLYYADRLKQEWEEKQDIRFSVQEWDELNLKLLSEHGYFTGYGKTKLQQAKMLNIERLKNRLEIKL